MKQHRVCIDDIVLEKTKGHSTAVALLAYRILEIMDKNGDHILCKMRVVFYKRNSYTRKEQPFAQNTDKSTDRGTDRGTDRSTDRKRLE